MASTDDAALERILARHRAKQDAELGPDPGSAFTTEEIESMNRSVMHAAVLAPGEPYKRATTHASTAEAFPDDRSDYASPIEGPQPPDRGQQVRDVVFGVAMAVVVALVFGLAVKGWLAGPLLP